MTDKLAGTLGRFGSAMPDDISPEILHDPYGEETLDISREHFEELLGEHQMVLGSVREGSIVKARVIKVADSGVVLDFGFKSEGTVSLDEFGEQDQVEVGKEFEVLLERLEDNDGVVVLSKKKADFLRVWELIREAYDTKEPVEGVLTRKIKGGVTVDIMGVDAFLPGSQIALRRVPNIEDLIGSTYRFQIIKLNKKRRNVVVSRRIILERERRKLRDKLVKELLIGQVRLGVVKNITDFGAFIDLGGLDGLLHITDMSWGRVGHPSEVVTIGQEMDVKVLDVDWDRERISLGYKQLLPYPWTDIEDRYPLGARVRGRVVSTTNYGAFVELHKGVEGLVHISEMSWTRSVRKPSFLVSVGDEVDTVILKVDPKGEKISLGMKQCTQDPWLTLSKRKPAGSQQRGTVRNLTSFGAFVEIEEGIDGLVHVSDMSWTKRVSHPSEFVERGQEIDVMVLEVDADNKRVSLGIKQLQDDPWPGLASKYHPGREREAVVVRTRTEGVAVSLGDVEGYVPLEHSTVNEARLLGEYFRAGEGVRVRVVESDAASRKIVLAVLEQPERIATGEESEPSGEAQGEEPNAPESSASSESSEDRESSESSESLEPLESPESSEDPESSAGSDEPEEPASA